MRFFACLTIYLVSSLASAHDLKADWAYAERRMRKAGLDSKFIKALQNSYEERELKNVLELNILLFLRKSDYHGTQVTDEAVDSVGAFITANQAALDRASDDFGLPPSIVASLLWIESRYGQNLGTFHVPSVYVHLLQGERSDVLKHLKSDGPSRFNPKPSRRDLAQIPKRVKKKAKWALSELRALQKIFRKRGDFALGLRGSFSGAFGMSQFLPSSYGRWARTTRGDVPPDLTRADDAIHSVAHYLKENGWKKTRQKTHLRALMNYNNSRDYANAILNLAAQVESQPLLSVHRSQTRRPGDEDSAR